MSTAKIIVTPKRSVLDPQGEAVKKALQSLGLTSVEHVHVGKYIELVVDEPASKELEQRLASICQDLLSNPVIEDYHLELEVKETKPKKADYEGLDEMESDSEAELVILEAKPKKAAKKLKKILKKETESEEVKEEKGKKKKSKKKDEKNSSEPTSKKKK